MTYTKVTQQWLNDKRNIAYVNTSETRKNNPSTLPLPNLLEPRQTEATKKNTKEQCMSKYPHWNLFVTAHFIFVCLFVYLNSCMLTRSHLDCLEKTFIYCVFVQQSGKSNSVLVACLRLIHSHCTSLPESLADSESFTESRITSYNSCDFSVSVKVTRESLNDSHALESLDSHAKPRIFNSHALDLAITTVITSEEFLRCLIRDLYQYLTYATLLLSLNYLSHAPPRSLISHSTFILYSPLLFPVTYHNPRLCTSSNNLLLTVARLIVTLLNARYHGIELPRIESIRDSNTLLTRSIGIKTPRCNSESTADSHELYCKVIFLSSCHSRPLFSLSCLSSCPLCFPAFPFSYLRLLYILGIVSRIGHYIQHGRTKRCPFQPRRNSERTATRLAKIARTRHV